MDNLVKAFQIFLKYGNPSHPTHCEHDVMYVAIDPDAVSEEDTEELDALGFFPDDEFGEMFKSYKYGSC